MLEVYVNDERVELKPNTGIGLTFQVGSIFSPNGRSGNLSNQFSIPKTKENTRILGTLSNLNSASNIPYQRNTGRVVSNGVDIFSNGFALVEETSDEYKLTIYSGNASYFDLIKGKNVNEIDLSGSNHIYNIANIIASFTSTNLDYIYPIVDFGNGINLLDNTLNQDAEALIPCAYLSAILEKMAADVGYELKGSFKLKDEYERLLLVPNMFGYLAETIAENTGSLKDVDTYSTGKHEIEPSNEASGATEITVVNTVFNTITGSKFSANQFIPDNNFIGNLEAFAKGTNACYVPERGEETIQTGTTYKGFKNAHVNKTHAVYVNNRSGFTEQLVWLHNIGTQTTTLLTALGVGGTQSITAIGDGEDGYLAYSIITASGTKVTLYDITNLTSIGNIYNNATAISIVDYLAIHNGRVVWYDGATGGGLYIYDIATATTKTIRTFASGAVGSNIVTDGEYVAYEEPTGNNIIIYDYTTATNTVVENQGAFSSFQNAAILGDYLTYFDNANQNMQSYKISTASLVTALNNATLNVGGAARTETTLAFSDLSTSKKVYFYDLTTDTLTDTGETDATSNSDEEIGLSDNYVAYLTNSNKDLRIYDINTPAITLVDNAGTNTFNKLILTSTDVVVSHIGGTVDLIRGYDIDAATFWTNVLNTQLLTSFEKAFDNDRIVFTNNAGLSSSVDDRVAIYNPIKTPLEIELTLVVKKDGVVIASNIITLTSSQGSTNYSLSISDTTFYVESGSVYSYELYEEATREESIQYYSNTSVTSAGFSFAPSNRLPYGALIDFAKLFDVQQTDVLRDVINQYCLTIQTNDLTKQAFLNSLDDLQSNLSRSKDWSDKIDLSKTPVIKYKFGSYGQVNNLRYADDDDVVAETGNGSFNIVDYNLQPEKTIIQLKLAAVNSSLRIEDEHTPTIPFFTSLNSYFDKKKSRIILLDDEVNKTVDWTNSIDATTGQSTVLPVCYFEKDGKTDSLDFTSLLASNYTVLQGMMNQAKFVSASFRLNAVDITNVDFTVPIYLDVHDGNIHINGFFYINKISNFKAESVTKVDLIRL